MFNIMDKLVEIVNNSGLASMFEVKEIDDKTDQPTPWGAYRVKPNIYKIRSFELWGTEEDHFFRIYHSSEINEDLRCKLREFEECITKRRDVVDFKSQELTMLGTRIKNVLLSEEIIQKCKATSRYAKTSKFEGLELPDVDTSQETVMGQVFTWRDIIAIWEDHSEDNNLKKVLSKNGIYLQRSVDGKSRYIGSAYGSHGIIGRWITHLHSNGDAQHLNLFVLENGYNNVLFSVIEFVDGTPSEIIQKESMWKRTLGTINYGPYNGIQLNNN